MTDQSHVLEYSGLAFLLVSVVMGLLSLWLNSAAGSAVAAKSPQLAQFLQNRPFMLLAVVLGAILLLLSGPVAPPPATSTPVSSPEKPAAPASIAAADTAAGPPPVPPVVSKTLPTAAPPTTPAQPDTASNPLPLPAPQPPQPRARPVTAEPRDSKPVPSVREKEPKSPPKTTTFGIRCTRLLEKVGSGEPLSANEKTEMVSSCQ
jgi:hypothetical protein